MAAPVSKNTGLPDDVKKPREAKRGRLSTVFKALDLLELLASEPREWGVTEIAGALGLSKSVAHGLLATLCDRNFVSADDRSRRYRLGFKAIGLGQEFDLGRELRIIALPILQDLTAVSGEASYLMLRRGTRAVTVACALPPTPIHLAIDENASTPLHTGASARVLLAYSKPEVLDAVLAEARLPRLADKTITEPDDLFASLAEIRAQGICRSASEMLNGIFAVAVPVFGPNNLIASLGIVGIEGELGARYDSLAHHLKAHAQRLAETLEKPHLS